MESNIVSSHAYIKKVLKKFSAYAQKLFEAFTHVKNSVLHKNNGNGSGTENSREKANKNHRNNRDSRKGGVQTSHKTPN